MEPEPYINLREILTVLHRRLPMILATVVLFGVVGFLMTLGRTPIFEATCNILIETPPDLVFSGNSKPDPNEVPSVPTQIQLMGRSATVARIQALAAAQRVKLGEGEIHNDFSLSVDATTNMVKVQARNTDPEKARVLADAVATAFVEQNGEFYSTRPREELDFVARKLPVAKARLDEADDNLRRFKAAQGLAAMPAGSDLLTRAFSSFATSQRETEAELRGQVQRTNELERQLSRENAALLSPDTLRDNSSVASLRAHLIDLSTQLAVAERRYTDKYPHVLQDLRRQITDTEAQLAQELRNIASGKAGDLGRQEQLVSAVANARAEAVALGARYEALRQIVDGYHHQLTDIPYQEEERTRLTRELKIDEGIYTDLVEQKRRLAIEAEQQRAAASIVDPAATPRFPAPSRRSLVLIFALGLGLVSGIGGVLLVEFMERLQSEPPPDSDDSSAVAALSPPPRIRRRPRPMLRRRGHRPWATVLGFACVLTVGLLALQRIDSGRRNLRSGVEQSDDLGDGSSRREPRTEAEADAPPPDDETSLNSDLKQVRLKPSLMDLVPSNAGQTASQPSPPPARSHWEAAAPAPQIDTLPVIPRLTSPAPADVNAVVGAPSAPHAGVVHQPTTPAVATPSVSTPPAESDTHVKLNIGNALAPQPDRATKAATSPAPAATMVTVPPARTVAPRLQRVPRPAAPLATRRPPTKKPATTKATKHPSRKAAPPPLDAPSESVTYRF